ncbi:MAG: M15 family metallopeptidase [Flavobacteriaceae bacterium]
MIRDKKTEERIKTIHPVLLDELHCIYNDICEQVNSKYVQVRFSTVFRPDEEQDRLYAKGRTKPGRKVTWVKAGGSYHNYGLAVDIVLLIDKDKNGTFESASWNTKYDGNNDGIADWLEVVGIFNAYGWRWGLFNKKGKRYDLPHFQKSMGYKTKELKQLPKDEKGYVIFK